MRHSNFLRIFFLLLFCVAFACPAYSETIRLKSGKTIEGKIIEKTDKHIKVDIGGITVTYYADQILTGSPLPEADNTKNKQNKKRIKYEITEKFYLQGIADTHFLKFCMVVPRNDMPGQTLSNIEIFPKPNSTFIDVDGNEIAVYHSSLLKAGDKLIIGFKYIFEREITPPDIKPESISDAYSFNEDSMKKYLSAEGEINPKEPSIEAKAASLTDGITNPYKKAKEIYNFITNNFRYDYALLQRFQADSYAYRSYSPQDTLARHKGICYDFAKLFVALARSSGLPARVVRGFAFDFSEDKDCYVENYGHAWAEFYLPDYGWVAVDPTYGLLKKDKFFCFTYSSHIPQEYGLSEVKDFGSLEKGWHLQFRSQTKPTRPPVEVKIEAKLVKSVN
ncbi:MAG: transglutaminase-like domain-containing protein [Candidatus Omnitrophota bacterium]